MKRFVLATIAALGLAAAVGTAANAQTTVIVRPAPVVVAPAPIQVVAPAQKTFALQMRPDRPYVRGAVPADCVAYGGFNYCKFNPAFRAFPTIQVTLTLKGQHEWGFKVPNPCILEHAVGTNGVQVATIGLEYCK